MASCGAPGARRAVRARTGTATSSTRRRAQSAASATLRPDVVWFGEMPYGLDAIEDAVLASDVFVSIGTSGNVYPAAGYVALATEAGARTVELNLEPSDAYVPFDEVRSGLASHIVPAWVDEVLA